MDDDSPPSQPRDGSFAYPRDSSREGAGCRQDAECGLPGGDFHFRPARSHRSLGGFTLIELMVVLALVAVVTGAAVLALPDPASATLDREAARLSAQLESARAESRISGVAIQWISTVDGFRFEPAVPGLLASGDHWPDAGMQVSSRRLTLGPEPIIAPQQVTLSLGGRSLTLATDGVGAFAVTSP